MKIVSLAMIAIFFTAMTTSTSSAQTTDRESVEIEYLWDLSDLYPSEAAWREAKEELTQSVDRLADFRGTLSETAGNLLACLQFQSQWEREFQKLYSYASNKANEDTRLSKYEGMRQEAAQLATQYNSAGSFVEPEILAMDESRIRSFLGGEEDLEPYRFYLEDLLRTREHTLSPEEEKIIAEAGRMARSPASIYNILSDAELPYPTVTLSDGKEVPLSKSAYGRYRALPNREDREKIFSAFFGTFQDFEGTYGAQLYAKVNSDLFYSKVRGYENTLEMALDPNNVPSAVYHSLIDNVNRNLDKFHRYLRIKERMLGVDQLKYSDLYAPTVEGVNLEYDYEEGKKLVLEAFEPLGSKYVGVVRKSFDERWIDVYPTEGKRSGAYSNDGGYDVHPYILMNYNGLFDDVSTLAHELGHAVHTYLSNENQPYPLADYPIFVAEVASTFNEALLKEKVLREIEDEDTRLSLLMKYLDGIKGTLFRQTQFAEYELRIHEKVEQGEALTGESLSEIYGDIVRRYYGHDKGVCEVPEFIDLEWAYILHFFNYTYYVYQYATSFTASTALAEQLIQGQEGAVERVLEFLSSGGSAYPIELLKTAGVDMTTSEPFELTMEAMDRTMDEIEAILDRKGL